MKTCIKCNLKLPLSSFAYKNKITNILQSSCKQCSRLYSRQHYLSNKKYYLNKNKKVEIKLRKFIFDYKSIHACILCGESNPYCLDFHHIKDKKFNISKMPQHGSMKKLLQEIKKCILLCANCHRKVHFDPSFQVSEAGIEPTHPKV